MKIDRVASFWNAVTIALGKQYKLEAGCDFQRVSYKGRRRYEQGELAGDVVFTCPESNAGEAEVRLFWPVDRNQPIDPIELHVPDVAEMCTLQLM